MARKTIRLDELLPPDIVIEQDGHTYVIPGDPPLQLILDLADTFEHATNDGIGLDSLTALNAQIVKLLQERDPSITESPFGVTATRQVLEAVFGGIGFEIKDTAKPAAARTSSARRPPPHKGGRS